MANPDIRHHASKGGRAAARRRLTLDRVERELPPLDSVDSAMQRLDRLGLWITAGMLTGSAGSAAVRSVEVWLRGHESRLTEQVVEELSGELQRVKAELRG